MAMTHEELRQLIKTELPVLMRDDVEVREIILRLSRNRFADQQQTEDRFDKVLAELKFNREAQEKQWGEQGEKWEAQEKKWEANQAELARQHEEQAQKWGDQEKNWEIEAQQRWEANQKELERLHEKLIAKIDCCFGALGARWGIKSERAFRDAPAGILEKSFGVQVLNVNDWDDEAIVFGRPDQVEIDVIIKNGLLILCELKSSFSKSDMYTFQRKALFYERRHGRKANRLLAISPMIDDRARQVGETLGIEMYGDSIDVREI